MFLAQSIDKNFKVFITPNFGRKCREMDMFLGILKGKLVVGNLLYLDFMFPRGAISISVAPLPHSLL